jgi:uncharacterized protein (DUF4415 family)
MRRKHAVVDLDDPRVGTPDAENPEVTPERWKEMRPWSEVFPGVDPPKPARGRPRIAHPRVIMTMRVDQKTLAKWRASGKGWQTRAAALLAKHAPRRRRQHHAEAQS